MINPPDTFNFERITNGWLCVLSSGKKIYCKDIAAIEKLIVGGVMASLDSYMDSKWDGKFSVTVDSSFTPSTE